MQYGADEQGRIWYNAVPYVRGQCDESLGSLYSYDQSRYVFDIDFGEYMPISGVSLSEEIDFSKLEDEINKYVEEQDANFYTMDVETVANTAVGAVESFLLSMQEETFLGCRVQDLLAAAKNLDVRECFRITDEGLTVVDLQEVPPEEPTALTKWLVGTGCAIVAAA